MSEASTKFEYEVRWLAYTTRSGSAEASVMTRRDTCCWCEYFDGGGAQRVQAARDGDRISGDCLSHRGARFEPMSNEQHHECFFAEEVRGRKG